MESQSRNQLDIDLTSQGSKSQSISEEIDPELDRKRRQIPSNDHMTVQPSFKKSKKGKPKSKSKSHYSKLPNTADIYSLILGKSKSIPSLHLTLDKSNMSHLKMQDLKNLILSVFHIVPSVNWALIVAASKINHVLLLVVDSLQFDDYHNFSHLNLMPNLTSFFSQTEKVLTLSPSNTQFGLDALMNRQGSWTCPINSLAEKNETTLDLPNLSRKYPISPPSSSLDLSISISPFEYLLNVKELEYNLFPLPGKGDCQHYLEIKNPNSKINLQNITWNLAEFPIYALDCEMCTTTMGTELTRVSLVDVYGTILYDRLVKPLNPILDYHTRFSGITEEILKDVEMNLKQVQKDLVKWIFPNVILAGHSLENDLHALNIIHYLVIDTSLLYPHPRGLPYKNSLKYLAQLFLETSIQQAQHDSNEDARIAMKLVLLKLEKGSEFGRVNENSDTKKSMNICTTLAQYGKRTALIDSNSHHCQFYADSKTSQCHHESDDQKITNKLIELLRTKRNDFYYARLSALSRPEHSTTHEVNMDVNANLKKNENEKISNKNENEKYIQELDERLGLIFGAIPHKTLVIVTGTRSETSRSKGVENKEKEAQRRTISFIKIITHEQK